MGEVVDRFSTPLYTVSEAARSLGVPTSTFATWVYGYVRRPPGRPEVGGAPVVTTVDAEGRGAIIPFIGLAEGLVLAAFRQAGVPLQRIRPAIAQLPQEPGLRHALASKSLDTDGAEVLYDYAEHAGDTRRRSAPATWSWCATTSGCSTRSCTPSCTGSSTPRTATRS